MFARILACGVTALLLCPIQADAQIYAWRDGSGTLVLSDRKLDSAAGATITTYAVPRAPTVRVTRPVAAGERAGEDIARFEPLVQEHASRHAISPALLRAVIQVESGFNPRARSPKGAMGLMQLMPATAVELGVRDPYDPAQNIAGGTTYLRRLLDRYDGNESLALAAYNAGAGAVDRYGRQVPPYRETQDYVKKIGSRAGASAASAARAKVVVYKTVETVDGRVVPRYSSAKPATGAYELITR